VGHHQARTRSAAGERQLAQWLSVRDAPAAVDYYTAAFRAVERNRQKDNNGRVVIAHQAIGAADFWLQEDPGTVRLQSPARCA
jgi:uncharacterized glyoxalase superfamily protein PhnB